MSDIRSKCIQTAKWMDLKFSKWKTFPIEKHKKKFVVANKQTKTKYLSKCFSFVSRSWESDEEFMALACRKKPEKFIRRENKFQQNEMEKKDF